MLAKCCRRPRDNIEQPCRPWHRRQITQHWEPCGRPPNQIAAIAARVDTRCDPASRAADGRGMTEQEMETARACAMRAGFRKAMTVLGPPHTRFGMTLIEVERIDAGCYTGCDAHQRAGVTSPQIAYTLGVARRLFEAVQCCRALIGAAG